MNQTTRYRFSARTTGTSVFNLTIPQLLLVGVGGLIAVGLISRDVTGSHVIVGVIAVVLAVAAAFTPIAGRPAYESVPTAARHVWRKVRRRDRWYTRLPLVATDGSLHGAATMLPRCLSGLELWAIERPSWAGADRVLAPLGLTVDRRTGTVTAAIAVKGAEFQLVEEAEQHQRIFAWGRVLASFAREASPVARICWHEWSCPAPLSEHLAWLAGRNDPTSPAVDAYAQLLTEQAVSVARHELRVTVTVDPGRVRRAAARPSARNATDVAVAMVRALSDRCREAGLVVSPPLSAAELADAVRVGADPAAVASSPVRTRSLAERTGLVPIVHVGPLAVDTRWASVRTDGGLHRTFWVSAWPTLDVGPRWLEPLLLDAVGTRTVTMVMEPISPRMSRRRMNKDAVTLAGNVHNREKHGFRIPVELERAKADLDRREVELTAGFAEYRFLALIDVCARDEEELDELSAAYVDLAAQSGLEIRALDGRHDAAWACSLPIGRAPDRDLIGGLSA